MGGTRRNAKGDGQNRAAGRLKAERLRCGRSLRYALGDMTVHGVVEAGLRARVRAMALAAALVAGCSDTFSSDRPAVTCLQLAGTWDLAIDLDSQDPGTSVCRVTWSVAQAGCDVSVSAVLPCSEAVCFLASPDCWGAAGEARGSPDGSLYLSWSWRGPYPCDYVADVQAQTDGATFSGTIRVEQLWAPGGICTGFLQVYPLTGTRRSGE